MLHIPRMDVTVKLQSRVKETFQFVVLFYVYYVLRWMFRCLCLVFVDLFGLTLNVGQVTRAEGYVLLCLSTA